jgi:hypothetical protein
VKILASLFYGTLSFIEIGAMPSNLILTGPFDTKKIKKDEHLARPGEN